MFPENSMLSGSSRLGKLSACLGAIAVTVAAQNAFAAHGPAPLEYNKDIRPIFAENCFGCHGPDSASRKASLRLDRFEDAILPRDKSKPAIVPGKPQESELISRIFNPNLDDIMPPTKTHKVLKPEEKETLKKWIAAGAKYQAHWSLIPPQKAPLPKVHHKSWVKNPIDAFILARLEKEGLKPAPEADKRTLARRVSLDLTGLPPKPEDVEAFLKDKSANAYEKYVDKMLATQQYGEHRARYWLDAARYADTHGIHFDNFREMWSYRDWVINAFNQNMHFDQFTIEQLAGDLLPNATLEQKIGSGFNRCNITSNEGGLIEEEYLVLYARDRTETTSQVFLGLTAGCAVCHDHKFDRLSQKEFYSMSAFFNNTTQKAMDGNIKDTPPIVMVPQESDDSRWTAIPNDMKTVKEKIEARRKSAKKDFNAWLDDDAEAKISGFIPKDKLIFNAPLNDNTSNTVTATINGKLKTITLATNAAWQEGAIAPKALTLSAKTTPEFKDVGNFEKEQPFSYAVWVKLGDVRDGSILARMDDQHAFRGWDLWLQGGRPAMHMISTWPDDALKVVAKKAIESNRWTHICVTYDGSRKAAGVRIYINGELQDVDTEADRLVKSIKTKVPFKIGQRHTTAAVEKAAVEDLRLYSRVLTAEEAKALESAPRMKFILAKSADKRTDAEKKDLYEVWLQMFDKNFKAETQQLTKLDQEENAIRMRSTVAYIMNERTNSPDAFVLYRGEYDKRRDHVVPTTPAALPPMPADFPRNRLGFAKWLLLPEQPLTSRVTVNRFWQELFGVGLVRTSGDFGVTGELPSNQELLDWLAVDFRESGWDVKRFFKLMVMSNTYRQSSVTTPEKLAKDSQNRLLSRGPRFRMDAEMVRDYALSASGLLVPKIGGPSVKPYQPPGVWEAVAMIGSNTRDYKQDTGDNLYRRSLYTFWKRAAPPASMDVFNAPSRETCTVRRERTDTPLQALVTLNDPQFFEAARNLAQRALENDTKEEQRINFIARRLLARSLSSNEEKIVEKGLKDMLDHYVKDTKDAESVITIGESKPDPKLDKPTLAAYTMVANELMNLDEVLNK